MNIPLSRLIEGMIATLRTDVIPHVQDPYARGQAVGIIDLLNNIEPRIDWATPPLAALVKVKHELLSKIAAVAPKAIDVPAHRKCQTAGDYLAFKAELDAGLGNALAALWPSRGEARSADAIALIQAHLHDEASTAMRTTRKPSFAEIASGGVQARKA